MASQCALPAATRSHYWHYAHARLWLLDAGATRSRPVEWPAGREEPPALTRMSGPGTSFREAGLADVPELARTMRVGRECVDVRFGVGKRCFLATVDGLIASYAWVTTDEEAIPELEHVVHLVAGEAYVWDCYTGPQFRRRGLLRSTLGLLHSSLGDLRYWAVIMADNRPSEHAFAKAGYRPVEEIRYLRIAGFTRQWIAAPPGTAADIKRRAAELLS